MDTFSAISFDHTRCLKPTGYPFITILKSMGPANLQYPILAQVTTSRDASKVEKMSVWIHSEEDLKCNSTECKRAAQLFPHGDKISACTNSRVIAKLQLERESESKIKVDFERCRIRSLSFKPARQEEITNALSVYVSRATYDFYKTPEIRKVWVLATHNNICIPLRLIMKPEQISENEFQGGALIRRFLDPKNANLDGKQIQFSVPQLISNEIALYSSSNTNPIVDYLSDRWTSLFGSLRHGWRIVNDLLERAFKLYFHAPKFALLSTNANLGDEVGRIVRLHKSAFDMIGIKPGDRVEIAWCGVKTFALALEEKSFKFGDEELMQRDSSIDSPFVQHLVIGISSSVRFDLGMPVNSAVEVRRTIVPSVLQQLTSTLLPVISVIAGGITIKLNSLVTAGLATVTLLLSLSKLRMTKAPSGRYLSW